MVRVPKYCGENVEREIFRFGCKVETPRRGASLVSLTNYASKMKKKTVEEEKKKYHVNAGALPGIY